MTTRIDLLAPPFAGHLHPLLAAGRALRDAGYAVRVLSTDAAQPAVRAAGLDGVALLAGSDADRRLRAIASPARAVGGNPLRLHRQFRQALELLGALARALDEHYRGERPALLIGDFTLPVVGAVAERYGIPWWTSLPSPCVLETADGPPAYFGGLLPAESAAGRLRDAAARRAVRLFKRLLVALYRRPVGACGFHAPYRADGSEAAYSPRRILALGVPEIEWPRRWPEPVRLIGPLLYTPPLADTAPVFDDGGRHVLVTLGTHLDWHKQRLVAAVARAAATSPGLSFHISAGDIDGRGGNRAAAVAGGGRCERYRYIDYQRWLHRYDLVVHHGGAGVMYYCLRHARSALVYPLDYDQFDHAARLVRAGVARRLRRLDDLAGAVGAALADAELAARCAALAPRVAPGLAERRLLTLVREVC